MKETEEVLREQLQNAMENGKYRILLHRTYTEGLGLNEDGTTRNICTKGLKIFGDRNIEFSASDYKNNIEEIMYNIKVAHTYKSSDKVFVLKIPINALEYTPGNTEPILYQVDEMSKDGDQCFCVCPEYVLGYVETSSNGISDLQFNTLEKEKIREGDRTFTSSVTGQYRQQNQQSLNSIKTDRYYTETEKRQILQILYAKSKKSNLISKKLKKYIENLMPDGDYTKWGLATPDNLGYHNIVERFCQEHIGKKITVKMVEDEFSKTRPVMGQEIVKAIPDLIGRENEANGPLIQEEIIQIVAEANGFDTNKMAMANQPRRSIVEGIKAKMKALFSPKQKLLEEPESERSTAHEEFVKKYEFKPKGVLKAKESRTIGKTVKKEGRE